MNEESIKIENSNQAKKITFEELQNMATLLNVVQISLAEIIFPEFQDANLAMLEYTKEIPNKKELSYSWYFKVALKEMYNEGIDLVNGLKFGSSNRDELLLSLKDRMARLRQPDSHREDIKEGLKEAA